MESAYEELSSPDFLLLSCSFVLVLVFFGGILTNFLVLLVFYRKPGLRTIANRFVINLMIINIVSCATLLPLTITNNGSDKVNNYTCIAEQFFSVFCSSTIVYSVLLIAIDQYFAVVDPLRYHCIISSWKGYFMIASTWLFCAGLGVFSSARPDFNVVHDIFQRCEFCPNSVTSSGKDLPRDGSEPRPTSPDFYHIIFCITYATTAFFVPFVLICFIYCSICVAASGNSKRARTSVLSNEESHPIMVNKFLSESEKPPPASGRGSDVAESSDTRPSDGHECVSTPSFVVIRASPPKPSRVNRSDCGVESAENVDGQKDDTPDRGVESDEKNVKPKSESELPFLKPTLKNNCSFSKLSSLHIQFSNSTENITDAGATVRRHSNVLLTTTDPEFENIFKSRSVQSSFSEIPSRSSFSIRSAANSTHIESSRSSSLNSNHREEGRHPPSRASSIKSTSSYIVHNIRHRISNASLFRYREEARAARISAVVIVMALFCWLPFFAVVSLHSGMCLSRLRHTSDTLAPFSILLFLTSTIVSPFLFAFRNRQIKKEVRKIFQFCLRFRWNCSKSFYTKNFSLTLKSQTVQLLTELGKSSNGKQETSHALSVK